MKATAIACSLGIAIVINPLQAQSPSSSPAVKSVPVTVDNFIRAESDMYFDLLLKRSGGQMGKMQHAREPVPPNSGVVRDNRDVIASTGVFDLDVGETTIMLPDPGKRFMSILVINQDHYTPVAKFGAGSYTLTRQNVGTRYAFVGIRIFADPQDPKDMQATHTLQDAIKVSQPGGPGKFEVPDWDKASQKKVRDALIALGRSMPDYTGAFGTKEQVNPVRHLIGTAIGWGGNPESVARYLNVTPTLNDGKTIYKLHVPPDVPVDAFWSVSLYDADGHFQENPYNAYNLNSVTTKRNADRSVDIQFGGCDGKILNCLPIMPGWNYTVRLYRPRPEILNGTWKFPEAVLVE